MNKTKQKQKQKEKEKARRQKTIQNGRKTKKTQPYMFSIFAMGEKIRKYKTERQRDR
jgi:hypothetical protein